MWKREIKYNKSDAMIQQRKSEMTCHEGNVGNNELGPFIKNLFEAGFLLKVTLYNIIQHSGILDSDWSNMTF